MDHIVRPGKGWPQEVDNKTTLFIGAALSSFTPTGFPTWGKFVEIVYCSLVDRATEGIGSDAQGKFSDKLFCINSVASEISAAL
jgi:hypothetical protein